MIAAEENQLAHPNRSRQPLRRDDAALLAAGCTERRIARRSGAAQSEDSWRRVGVVSRRSGAARLDRPALFSPRHRLELRPRRRRRLALPLSRLALRYLRPGHRSARGAGRRRQQGGDSSFGVSLPRSWRGDFYLHGSGRTAARAQLRVSHRGAGKAARWSKPFTNAIISRATKATSIRYTCRSCISI